MSCSAVVTVTMSKNSKEEDRKFMLECIEMYRSLPALWHIKSKDYGNRIKKNEQYEQLLHKYKERYPDATKGELVKKFNSLRTNFRKELKRIANSEKSGAGTDDIAESTLWYFEEMKFIIDQEQPSMSQNTMQVEEEEGEQNMAANVGGEGDISSISINEETTPSKKKKKFDSQELMMLACKRLQQSQTESEKIAAAWAVELQKMTPQQQLFAKKAIGDILFEGQMGTLHRNSVQINNINSTPYSSERSPMYYEATQSGFSNQSQSGFSNQSQSGYSNQSQSGFPNQSQSTVSRFFSDFH